MKRIVSASAGLACLLAALVGLAAVPETITDPAAPLVKQLELRFASSLAAARSGEVDAYWNHRTAASRNRPPALDGPRLKMLAELLPALDTLQFVRLDSTGKVARALYRWRKQDTAQYTVIVFRFEQNEWKIDDFSVRRSGVAAPPRRTLSDAETSQRSEAAATVPAPSLEAPRL
jgi:hypothetical protein